MPLHETVEASTLKLIRSLQEKQYLKGFYLVGGTALALYLGHRKSIDIDLFTNSSFDAAVLLENLHQDFPYQLSYTAANTLKGSIDNIKVDLIAHRYPYIHEPNLISGIHVLSMQDIVAMKLNAISTSGQRSKDFIDIYYLLEKIDIESMLLYYKTKYGQSNDTFILKSLIYYDEVDLSDWPVLLKDSALKWGNVKKLLTSRVLRFTKNTLKDGNHR
jgi:predicted nucleotidyltransferase component of viral defense system